MYLKQKAEGGDVATTTPPATKKAKMMTSSEDDLCLFCEPCNLALTSQPHAQQHYDGRNHKRKVNGLAPLKAGYFNTRTGKWQRHPTAEGTFKPPISAAADPIPQNNITCCNDVVVGKEAVATGSNLTPQLSDEPVTKTEIASPGFSCTLCSVSTTSQSQLDMHLNGKSHKSKQSQKAAGTGASVLNQQFAQVPYVYPAAAASTKKHEPVKEVEATSSSALSIYRTPSGQYYCSSCNLSVNSESQFKQHRESKKHKLKEACVKPSTANRGARGSGAGGGGRRSGPIITGNSKSWSL